MQDSGQGIVSKGRRRSSESISRSVAEPGYLTKQQDASFDRIANSNGSGMTATQVLANQGSSNGHAQQQQVLASFDGQSHALTPAQGPIMYPRLSIPVNDPSLAALFLNPHAAAQAAAAMAAAAQQMAQFQATNNAWSPQQQHPILSCSASTLSNANSSYSNGTNGTSTENPYHFQGTDQAHQRTTSHQAGVGVSFAPSSMTASQSQGYSYPHQLALSAHAAALLTGGGANQAGFFNFGAGGSVTAAAQAFASVMQQQHQVPSPVAPSLPLQHSIGSMQQANTNLQEGINQSVHSSTSATNSNYQKDMATAQAVAAHVAATNASNNALTQGQQSTRSAPPSLPNSSTTVATPSNPVLLAHMQNWKLSQLEAHVQLLRDANQTIPQQVVLLIADARRREGKRTAKRVANRKSACTSRARKKALVEEMTKTNARLRRQATILALLPVLVVAITVDGEITFCSQQVERVLRHSISDLIGSSLFDIILPTSRTALFQLIKKLVASDQSVLTGATESGNVEDEKEGNAPSTNASGENILHDAAVVSDQSDGLSFPLSVVKVRSGLLDSKAANVDSSISSGATVSKDKRHHAALMSSMPNDPLKRLTEDSSSGQHSSCSCEGEPTTGQASGSNENCTSFAPKASTSIEETGADSEVAAATSHQLFHKPIPPASSGDDSSASSEKNLRNANKALNRNVRWHNAKNLPGRAGSAHKDDVTGAYVTANNADARLSSLQHHPRAQIANGDVMTDGNKESILSSSNLTPDLKVESSHFDSLKKVSSKIPGRFSNFECSEEGSSSSTNSLDDVDEMRTKDSARSMPSRRNHTVNENSSEDSGYRESGESGPSREDSSSTASDDSNRLRPKPFAPTCNVCLIRNDLTTIWCAVTSSIRTRYFDEETTDDMILTGGLQDNEELATNLSHESGSQGKKDAACSKSDVQPSDASRAHVKELLLCLRPIRDGEEVAEANLRIKPKALIVDYAQDDEDEFGTITKASIETPLNPAINSNNSLSSTNALSDDVLKNSNSLPYSVQGNEVDKARPMKKRPLQDSATIRDVCNNKKSAVDLLQGKKYHVTSVADTIKTDDQKDTEKSVAESLMLMMVRRSDF